MGTSYVINALKAPDAYSPASTIEGAILSRITMDVTNQSVYWQLKRAAGGNPSAGNWDGAEVFQIPGSRELFREGVVGIRFRAAIPNASLPAGSLQAVITCEGIVE